MTPTLTAISRAADLLREQGVVPAEAHVTLGVRKRIVDELGSLDIVPFQGQIVWDGVHIVVDHRCA